jgi:palmitoyltransferase
LDPANAFTYYNNNISDQDNIDAFRKRQHADLNRRNGSNVEFHRRRPVDGRTEAQDLAGKESDSEDDAAHLINGKEGWRNSEGESLADFGVEEDVEFFDQYEVPLAKLMANQEPSKSNA